MEKNRVKLNICGSDYVLTSEDSESYMRLVGDKVDEKLKEILAKSPRISMSMASVLSSLEFCDELLKSRDKVENLKGQLSECLEENTKNKEACNLAEKEVLRLKNEISDLKSKLSSCKAELDILKNSKLSQPEKIEQKSDIVTFSLLENEVAGNY